MSRIENTGWRKTQGELNRFSTEQVRALARMKKKYLPVSDCNLKYEALMLPSTRHGSKHPFLKQQSTFSYFILEISSFWAPLELKG